MNHFVSTIYLLLDLVFHCNIKSSFLIKRSNRHLVQIAKSKLIKKIQMVLILKITFYLIYVT
jgi:hypothetical protein